MKKQLLTLIIFLNLAFVQLHSQTCFFGNYPPVNTLTLGFTNGAWIAHKYNLASTATLTGLGMNLTAANGATYRMAIYTDVTNQPGNLVALANTGTMVAGQNFVLLPTATVIPAGNYWIAALFNSSGTALTTVANANGYVFLPGSISTAPANLSVWNAGQSYDLDYWAMINNPTITVSGSTNVCLGSTTTLTASGAATYSWSTGQIGATTTVTPSAAITLTCLGIGFTGCYSGTLVSLAILPSPTVVAAGSTSVCAGNAATLSASGGSTYVWTSGTGSSVVVSPTLTTIYTVTCTAGNGCEGTATATVSVLSAPSLSLSSTNPIVCMGQNAVLSVSGANTYTWSGLGGGNTVTVSQSVTTTYTVKATGSNGCESEATITQSITSCVGLKDIDSKQIHFFPNPTSGILHVEFSDFSNGAVVTISDLTGRILINKFISSEDKIMDLSVLESGSYLVTINAEQQKKTYTIIKQ